MPAERPSPRSGKPRAGGASGRAKAGGAGAIRGPGAGKPRREPPPLHLRDESYWAVSMRPLHVLVFLMPLVVLYEVGSALYLANLAGGPGGTGETIKAYRLLGDFFTVFGAAGLYMPGIALVTVLLVWHGISRDEWKVRWNSIAGMAAESVAWTLPLIVLSAIMARLGGFSAGGAGGGALGVLAQPGGAGGGGAELAALPWQAKLAVSIGAGLYEEVLFRFVGIALLHFVVKDLLGARELQSSVVAVVGAAVAFALYHDISSGGGPGGGFDYLRFLFLTLAGIYLGAVYVLRGFGIVVGTHALYDVVALVLLAPSAQG